MEICYEPLEPISFFGGPGAGDIIKKLEAQGTEIFSCGTCLEYYQRKDKLMAGKIGNMRDTVNAMLGFARVLTL